MVPATLAFVLALAPGFVPVPAPGAPAAVATRFAASPQDDDPARVAGMVVDEDGAPVTGARVIAVWKAVSGKEALREELTTGADGSFAAAAPSDRGAPRLSVFADGFVFEAIAAAQGEDLKVVGTRILEVAFDLRLPDGTAPEDASLRFDFPEETGLPPAFASWRGARRKVIGKSLRATVTVHAGLYNLPNATEPASRWRAEPIELDAKSLDSSTVRVDLVERQVLLIEVVGNEAQPSRVSRNVVALVKESEFDESNPRRSLSAAARAQRNPGGGSDELRAGNTRYRFDLEPGDYVVGYLRQGFHLGEWKRFTVGEGETRVQLEIEDPEARGHVTVECVDNDGKPVEVNSVGVKVERTGGSSSSSSTPMESLGSGEYRFLRSTLDPSGLLSAPLDPEKRIELTFHAPGLGSRKLQIDDDVERYVLRFLPVVDLEIRPFGPDWRSFHLRIEGQDNGYQGVFDLGENEVVKIEGVQGSVFTVDWVRADEEAMAKIPRGRVTAYVRGLTIRTDEIDVTRGSRVVELSAPAVFSVTVDASAFEPGTSVGLSLTREGMSEAEMALAYRRGAFSGNLSGTVGDDRLVRFEGIAGGAYQVRVDRWLAPLAIEVDADLEVVLPRVEATALRVVIEDVGGSLSRSGLKPDDVIVGHDGERFASLESLQSVQADASEEPVAILVQRGEMVIELELGPLGEYAAQGGYLAPSFGN